jgi:hypothetical protein
VSDDSQVLEEILTELRQISIMQTDIAIAAESISEDVQTIAYLSLPWWTRLRLSWRHASRIVDQTGHELAKQEAQNGAVSD